MQVFEPLYHGDRLHAVNPAGDVGLITLWSPWRAVERKLLAEAPELLDPAASRIAVAANLYGDGWYAMFCNLLFNPQVRHLVAVGEDLGLGVPEEIEAFLARGTERATLLGRTVRRVVGTGRVVPDLGDFDEERLRGTLTFAHLGKLSSEALAERLREHVAALPAAGAAAERVRVTIPDAGDAVFRPSEVGAHQVVRRRPYDCWEELVVRATRFGRPVELSNGPRLELLNAKAVITDPAEESPELLARAGFDLDRFHRYQQRMLSPDLPEGIAYTYGHRLRGHFEQGHGTDTLRTVADVLRTDPRSRGAYVSLWDTSSDLREASSRSTPCLTTLFFRASGDRLTLTATYRAHNLLTAWLENVYGLMAVQRHVCEGAGMEPGAITVVSHSLGIDPRSPRYELARGLAEDWSRDDDVDRETGKSSLREDPHGYFVVSIDDDRGVIVAEHRYEGVLVKRYEAQRAVTIEQQVAADMAVSLVSHALWLGRELTRNEARLRRVAA